MELSRASSLGPGATPLLSTSGVTGREVVRTSLLTGGEASLLITFFGVRGSRVGGVYVGSRVEGYIDV